MIFMNLISSLEEKYGLKNIGCDLLPAGVNDTYLKYGYGGNSTHSPVAMDSNPLSSIS
jgi:hypothetical protein